MKEATGEANMTVITIVIIALVLAIGTPIITNVLNNSGKSAACSAAGGVSVGGACYDSNGCTTDDQGKTDCTGAEQMTCKRDSNGNMCCALQNSNACEW